MFDVVVRGGDVVDGTGAPRVRADVGITGDRVTAIADLSTAEAATSIDATGRVVTPGFVDVHTHVDAQVFWDTTLSPSPLHGVTTVIGGNCGFTIAPLSDNPADGEYLMRMLARVEGMPLPALETGVPWNWKTTAEYFDAFDGTLAINTAFKVGHSALRRVVMGPDATKREATLDEIVMMQNLLRAGLEAGAIGFSTSWARTHNDADGAMVPSRYASKDELVALARVCGEFPGTSLEMIAQVGRFEPWAMDVMADMSVAAQRPLNWNVLTVAAKTIDDAWHNLGASDVAADRGGKVVGLTIPMLFSARLSFAGGFLLDALPGWEGVMLLPKAEKMAVLADPEERRRLDDLSRSEGPLRNLANWKTKVIFDVSDPANEQYRGRTVEEIAQTEGKTPFDALVDIALADELTTSFGTPLPVEPKENWEARAAVWRDGRAVIGASDAGAHLDLFLTANYVTEMLEKAVRVHQVVGLEEAVQLMTSTQADLYGIVDRGRLVEGAYADVVVFDPETIASTPIHTRVDLPSGAPRLYAAAIGIDHVLCNGQEIVRGGEFTPARPGHHFRAGTDTVTPSLA